MRRLIKYSLILILLLQLAAFPALAETAQLSIALEDAQKQPIDGLSIELCRIAALENGELSPTEGFKDAGISLRSIQRDPSPDNAKTVYRYAKEHSCPFRSATASKGKVEFENLELGIWLVSCPPSQKHSFNPYFVFLPYEKNGTLCYTLASAPKTEINNPNDKSIYVLKKWEDENNAAKKRPQSVTITLSRDQKPLKTIVLSKENGWTHTFKNLPDSGRYTVTEEPIKFYTPAYNGDSENGFIITNTYQGEKLPQTGQQWWPILLLAITGAAFLLLGILEFIGKKHEKEHP